MSEKSAHRSVQYDADIKPFSTCDSGSLMRWSSEPESLTSLSSNENSKVADTILVNNTRSAIISLQGQLSSERDRCRQLEADLGAERRNRGAGVEAVMNCVERERTENRHLQAMVWQLKRQISKLRGQLRTARSRLTAVGVSLSDPVDCSSDTDLGDVCSSDESGWGKGPNQPRDSSSSSSGQRVLEFLKQGRVRQRLLDDSVTDRPSAEHKAVQTAAIDEILIHSSSSSNLLTGTLGGSSSLSSLLCNQSDRELLKQRLSDTISTCLRLAQSLNMRKRSIRSESSTDDGFRAAADEVADRARGLEDDIEHNEELYRQQVARLEARLQEVEQVNQEWQQYAEQRDQYVRVLAQRCAELEQSHSRCSMPSSGAFTDEQQRKIDRLLLDQRHKTELAEEARLKAENESQRLEEALKKLTFEKMDVDTRLVQAVTRLKASDARRCENDERIQILETQVTVFGEDFANEQRDRLKARKRLAEVEHQLEVVMRKLRAYESGTPVFIERQDDPNASFYHRSFDETFPGDHGDASLPLLIARGVTANYSRVEGAASPPPSPPPHRNN